MKGKQLNNEPEVETATERIIKGIALLNGLNALFIKEIKTEPVIGLKMNRIMDRITEVKYHSFEEVFAKQCEEAKADMSYFSDEVFAHSEAKRIKAILENVEALVEPEYYEKHEAFHRATDYINTYLLSKKEPQQEAAADRMDYEGLRKDLAIYLTISKESLRSLVEHGTIEPGASATWKGKRVEAYRFAHWLSPGDKHFINIFNKAINMKGRPLHASDGDEKKGFVLDLSGSIFDVLKRYPK